MQQSAEEAAHAHAQAAVSGDYAVVVRDLTPEALAQLMQAGSNNWNQLSSYELTLRGSEDEDFIFDITYQTEGGLLALTYRFRNIDNGWKVVQIDPKA